MPTKFLLMLLAAACLFVAAERSPKPVFRAGKDFALFFAIKNYDQKSAWPDLRNPIKDATAIAEVLREQYDFQTEVVENPTKAKIRETVRVWQQKTFADDAQLFIFFTGHGHFDELDKKGFFVPRDGRGPSEDTFGESFLSYPDLERSITAIPCRHILLGIDACFSGTFDAGIALNKLGNRPVETDENRRQTRIAELLKDQSRFVFTSGEKRKTSDGIDHSPLAERLLTVLKKGNSEDGFLTAGELKLQLRKIAPPPPFTTFEGHGVDGEFLFVGKNSNSITSEKSDQSDDSDLSLWKNAERKNTIESYQAYLLLSENGKFRAEAQNAIDHLKSLALSSKAMVCKNEVTLKILDSTAIVAVLAKDILETYSPKFDRYDVLLFSDASGKGQLTKAELSINDLDKFKLVKIVDTVDNFSCWGYVKLELEAPVFDMVVVEGDTFKMGCAGLGVLTGCLRDEKPVHEVILSDFKIGRFEITQREWKAVMGKSPTAILNCDDCPVQQVSWNDVQVFLKKLNSKTRKNYRLPTEAEWEFAAIGGQKSRNVKYAGSNDADEVAWCMGNAGKQSHPVGKKKANELGLFDMSGNASEWCSDRYGDNYYGSQAFPIVNPKGPAIGNSFVLRGGSYGIVCGNCGVRNRFDLKPDERFFNCGFRLAESI